MPGTDDPHRLQRFVAAQDRVFAQVVAELGRGRKSSHWMWFIFPQRRGLGSSDMAAIFGIATRDEALAYWRHPLLGPRLKQCTELVLATRGGTAEQIFGPIDALKFCSSMTLFEQVAPEEASFAEALERFCGGRRDARTTAMP